MTGDALSEYDTESTPDCIMCGSELVIDAEDAAEGLRERADGELSAWDRVTLLGDEEARDELVSKPQWTGEAVDPMMGRDYFCTVCQTSFNEGDDGQIVPSDE